jgi:hypothetical protein
LFFWTLAHIGIKKEKTVKLLYSKEFCRPLIYSKQAVEYLTLRKSSNSKSKPKSTTDGRKKFTKDNQKCLFYSKKNIQGEQFDWFPKQSGILHNSLNSN